MTNTKRSPQYLDNDPNTYTAGKHTPGPWRTYKHGGNSGTSVCDETGHLVTIYVEGRTDEEAYANATLIAASPDLLKSLKLLILQIEGLKGESSVIDEDLLKGEEMKQALVAIAKATGEQS